MSESEFALAPEESLKLHQFLQVRFWRERSRSATTDAHEVTDQVGAVPDRWELTRGVELHDWQRGCIDTWFSNGKRGVIKVVTGAGKTILALAIAERLQTERLDLRVAVVVPTIVLLEQWRDELMMRGNLPARAIGLMGGGRSDGFGKDVRILLCVLNSAAAKLADEVERAGVGHHLLLVIDECHRTGATVMRQVFRTRRAYSLGLSATPERDEPWDDEDEREPRTPPSTPAFGETVIGRELGNVVFEMNYAEAVQLGVLPEFRVLHYGLLLQPDERERYERLSREIKNLRSELETRDRRGLALIRWCRKVAERNPKAARLVALTTERKRLLYRMGERPAAVTHILGHAFASNQQTRAILFHESIDEVMYLFDLLRHRFPVVAEHSELPDEMRGESLRLFRNGCAQVVVSARSLIEGFNVPSADLGIIVAASSSVRQRVQTLGRLLRRHHERGVEKKPTLCVLYAANTVDEMIYEKADWEEFVGAARNEYFVWPSVETTEPEPRSAPPRRPQPSEIALDADSLIPGQSYPGNSDEGHQYSADTQGTVRDEDQNLVAAHAELETLLAPFLSGGGRFRVTPRKQLVIKLEKTREGWQALYLGRLQSPLEIIRPDEGETAHDVYVPGDPYPLRRVRGRTFSVLQRDKRLIARKTSRAVRFVVPAERLTEPEKHQKLMDLQQHLAVVIARGHRINKITVTPEGHVVYLFGGQAYFAGSAPERAAGFQFEEDQPNEEAEPWQPAE